jgi:hypothetical protein
MKRFLVTALVAYSLVLGAACDKTKTVKQLEDLATRMRIHNRDIARTANEFHAAGRLSDGFHKGILTAADKFSTALDAADAAIVSAKKVTAGTELKTALDYAERLIDVEVFGSFVDVVAAVTNIPDEVKQKIEVILASIRLLFSSIKNVLAEASPMVRREVVYAE